MPGPAATPFDTDHRLPERVDVVVIGGGIIGTSAALELSERGHSVLLCEKGQIGGEQSSRNWGWVRIARRDPREIPLMVEAIRLWEGLDARLGRKTGYAKCGILFSCASERALAQNESWTRHVQAHQIESRRLGLSRRILPTPTGPWWSRTMALALMNDTLKNCSIRFSVCIRKTAIKVPV